MTLYDLIYKTRLIGSSISDNHVPILKDGKEVDLDFHIVSEDAIVKHIEMIEK